MKGLFKFLWLIISLAMIGVGGYFTFIYQTTEPATPEPVEEAVYFEGVRLIDTTEDEARAIINAFNTNLAYDSFWWLPDRVDSINDLDNRYRLIIASYQLMANEEEHESTTRDDIEVFAPSEMLAAWHEVVGDIPLTDGTPCYEMELCNQLLTFNSEERDYEVTNNDNDRLLSIVNLTEIRKVEEQFILSVRALYVEQQDDNSYRVYSSPSKDNAVGTIDAMEGDGNERQHLATAGARLLEQSAIFEYTYRLENENFLFSAFRKRSA